MRNWIWKLLSLVCIPIVGVLMLASIFLTPPNPAWTSQCPGLAGDCTVIPAWGGGAGILYVFGAFVAVVFSLGCWSQYKWDQLTEDEKAQRKLTSGRYKRCTSCGALMRKRGWGSKRCRACGYSPD